MAALSALTGRILLWTGALTAVTLVLTLLMLGIGRALPSPDVLAYTAFIWRDERNDILLLDVDRRLDTHLTKGPSDDFQPAWSPDGTRLAYISRGEPSDGSLHLVNADGSQHIVIPTTSRELYFPVWSPDGGRIAFLTFQGSDYSLDVFSVETGAVTTLVPSGTIYSPPVWSPDSREIVYGGVLNLTDIDLFAVTLATQEIAPLVNTTGNDVQPFWSPDPSVLYFVSGQAGNEDLFRLSLPTGDIENLTDHPAEDGQPSLSPDGTRLAFLSTRDGWKAIYRLDVNSGQLQALTGRAVLADTPVWSPDGRRIVFMRQDTPGGTYDLSLMDADGTGMHPLTIGGSVSGSGVPVWQP